MKILVVDDSMAMRKIVRRTMRQAGFGNHDYVEAENGQKAFDLLQAESVDLVLADWNMPEMSGIELLKALREVGKNIPFGFITSEGTTAMRTQAMDAGALFVLTKPFTADDMSKTLGPHLQ